VHNDEVYFRDTAHGFLAWSLATLAMATLFATSITGIVGGGVHAASSAVAGAGTAAGASMAAEHEGHHGDEHGSSQWPDLEYSIDSLVRDPKAGANAPVDNAALARIFTRDLVAGDLNQDDKTYVAQVVAQRTGSTQADAEQRVTALFNKLMQVKNDSVQKAKEAAEAARKATAYASLWMALSLFVGAFFASVAATFGGRLRDNVN
jgi:hypothetical protein